MKRSLHGWRDENVDEALRDSFAAANVSEKRHVIVQPLCPWRRAAMAFTKPRENKPHFWLEG
jgi:hypothetical protein